MENQTHSTGCTCQLNPRYVTTPSGILKIIEFVLAVIAFACATDVANKWYAYQASGFGWVSFVAIGGFIMALIYLVFHLLVTSSWTWTAIVEVISYGVWTIFFLIAGIVAASQAKLAYYNQATAGAACAFSFFSMAAWAIDTAFQLMNIRVTFTSSSGGVTTTATTTTTTTTSTPKRFEENPQY